jgi:Asp-tRNA(Asn)/Glu-tRNA(Gln) amidotransferase A subunit family amidase
MNADELCFEPAHRLYEKIVNKEISAREVADAFLERIDRVNPKINAYTYLDAEGARKRADALDLALRRGGPVGPLHGVPVCIKDLDAVAGMPQTMGCKLFSNLVAPEDAVYVKRLREAGAVILGKTNAPEFGFKGVTDNPLFGATSNPWRLDRTPGGSSGGTAAAVAAGLAPVGHGNDGGGSIRIPASCAGLFGIKCSLGRIPNDMPFDRFMSTVFQGPLARTVRDAARMVDVMSGPSDRDPFSLPPPSQRYEGGLTPDVKGCRMAWTPDFGLLPVDPEIRAITSEAARAFEDLGAHVEQIPVKLPADARAFGHSWYLNYAGMRKIFPDEVWKENLSPEFYQLLCGDHKITVEDLQSIGVVRTKLYEAVRELFSRYDFLLSPTITVEPFRIGIVGPEEVDGTPIEPFGGWLLTWFFNWSGHPAASVPCGFTRAGLPVGLQIVGRTQREETVFCAAHAFEQARPWAQHRPTIDWNRTTE